MVEPDEQEQKRERDRERAREREKEIEREREREWCVRSTPRFNFFPFPENIFCLRSFVNG